MSDTLKSIWFAAITALVASLLLTGASSGLKEYRLANIKIDNQKNLLKSVGLIHPDVTYSGEDIEKLYRENIKSYRAIETGDLVAETAAAHPGSPLFLYVRDDQTRAYILPVHSKGLWAKIDGYLAIKNDGRTISGFTVYNHGETPGLGGEIEKAWFQKNFRGKQIVDQNDRFVSVGITKGKVADTIAAESQANFVDGISGATLTGRFLSEGLRETLLTYEKVSANFRQGRINLNTAAAAKTDSP